MAWVPTLPFPGREGESEGLGPKKLPLKGGEGWGGVLIQSSHKGFIYYRGSLQIVKKKGISTTLQLTNVLFSAKI
jgi:hypothetical protein